MSDFRINTRWIIRMHGNTAQVEEYKAVFIKDGRISAIESINSPLPAKQTIELPHHVLLPGYVNAYGHAAMSLLRGYADDLPLMTWLNEHIWPVEGKWVSPEFVYQGTQLAIAVRIQVILNSLVCHESS